MNGERLAWLSVFITYFSDLFHFCQKKIIWLMSAGRYNCEEAYNISSREGREGKDSRYDREIGVAGMGG